MPNDKLGEHRDHIEHSHSLITKLISELEAVVEAIGERGVVEAHHCEEAANFLERLELNLRRHVDFEETELFPELRDGLGESSEEKLEEAVAQHRSLTQLLERLEQRFEQLEEGAEAESADVDRLRETIVNLGELFDHHDSTERAVFEAVD